MNRIEFVPMKVVGFVKSSGFFFCWMFFLGRGIVNLVLMIGKLIIDVVLVIGF